MHTSSPAPFARLALRIAGIVGALGVAAGAFGAHALKAQVNEAQLGWWATGAQYHLIHAVVLLALAVLASVRPPSKPLRVAFYLITAGIVVFAGSLYAMALTDIRVLGAITPIGGSAIIAGWVVAAFGVSRTVAPDRGDAQ